MLFDIKSKIMTDDPQLVTIRPSRGSRGHRHGREIALSSPAPLDTYYHPLRWSTLSNGARGASRNVVPV